MKLFPACTCTKHLHFCSQLAVDCSVECRCRKFPPTITYLLTKHTGIPWKSQEREQSRQIHNWTTCALLPKWRQAVMLISCYSCDEIPAELHQAGRLKKGLSEGHREYSRRVSESTLGGSARVLSESQGEFLSDCWLLQGEWYFNVSGAARPRWQEKRLLRGESLFCHNWVYAGDRS